jgi:hypothetical protein
MTTLLVGTFVVSGIHTLLWIPRALRWRRELQRNQASLEPPGETGREGAETADDPEGAEGREGTEDREEAGAAEGPGNE